jgi:hypothetical protein
MSQARPAATLALLLLAACAGGDKGPPPQPPACPATLFLQGAERTSAWADEAAPSPENQRYVAAMTNLRSGCAYNEAGVDVDLAFDLIVERGPALADQTAPLTFFVATMGPGSEILAKQVLTSQVAFEPSDRVAGSAEEMTLRLPGVTPEQAGDYALYLGFQLEEAELEERLQPLLR